MQQSLSGERGRTRLQRLADFGLSAGLFVPLVLVAADLVEWMQLGVCPSGTFLAGTMRPNVQMLGLIAAIVGLAYLFRMLLFQLLPAMRAWLYPQGTDPSPDWMSAAAVAAVAAGVIVSVWAALSQYCAAPSGISYRASPWDNMRLYAWSDVNRIETSCSHGPRASWNTSFVLVMSDGFSINIMDSPKNFAPAYLRLTRALEGNDFYFNSERVAPDCASENLRMLVTRP